MGCIMAIQLNLLKNLMQFFDLNTQNKIIKNSVMSKLMRTFNNSDYINGQYVKDFEKILSKYSNRYVVSCGNGTDALMIA